MRWIIIIGKVLSSALVYLGEVPPCDPSGSIAALKVCTTCSKALQGRCCLTQVHFSGPEVNRLLPPWLFRTGLPPTGDDCLEPEALCSSYCSRPSPGRAQSSVTARGALWRIRPGGHWFEPQTGRSSGKLPAADTAIYDTLSHFEERLLLGHTQKGPPCIEPPVNTHVPLS